MPVIKDQQKRDANAMRIFGCSEQDAIALNGGHSLRDRSSLAMAYVTQKHAASVRRIEWLLTFSDWLCIWSASGKLHLRGVGVGRYVMARHGDCGPYEKSNVSIQLATDNSRDGLSTRFFKGV